MTMPNNTKEFVAMMLHFGWRKSAKRLENRIPFARPGRGGKNTTSAIYVPGKSIFICHSTSTPFCYLKEYTPVEVLDILSSHQDFYYTSGRRCNLCGEVLLPIPRVDRQYLFQDLQTKTAGVVALKVPVCPACFATHTAKIKIP